MSGSNDWLIWFRIVECYYSLHACRIGRIFEIVTSLQPCRTKANHQNQIIACYRVRVRNKYLSIIWALTPHNAGTHSLCYNILVPFCRNLSRPLLTQYQSVTWAETEQEKKSGLSETRMLSPNPQLKTIRELIKLKRYEPDRNTEYHFDVVCITRLLLDML